jgi:hypothetical protein
MGVQLTISRQPVVIVVVSSLSGRGFLFLTFAI